MAVPLIDMRFESRTDVVLSIGVLLVAAAAVLTFIR
jgi:hypothetical protein